MTEPRTQGLNTWAAPKGSDDYATPFSFGAKLDVEYGLDAYDPCPLNGEALRRWDGQTLSPASVKAYRMNPPYSDVKPWLQLARADQLRGKTVLVILKGDTSTVWFHELVLPYAEIRLVRGRVRFGDKGPAPFNSIVAVFHGDGSKAGQLGAVLRA